MYQELFRDIQDVDAYTFIACYDLVQKQDRSCRKISRYAAYL